MDDLDDWTKTLPIVADWSEYGRHAAHRPLSLAPPPGFETQTRPGPETAGELAEHSGATLTEACDAAQPRGSWVRRLHAVRHRRAHRSVAREGFAATGSAVAGTTAGVTGASPIHAPLSLPSAAPAVVAAVGGQRRPPLGAAGLIPTTTVTVTIASPTADREAATAKLLVRLCEQLARTGHAVPADGRQLSDLVVSEPRESTDSYGRVWFWFRGTLLVSHQGGVQTAADERAGGHAVPGRRAALGGGGRDQESACAPPGERRGQHLPTTDVGAVIQVAAWPLRLAPRRHGTGWECSLPTAAAAARVRRELRVRLLRAAAAGHCTVDAGEDLLLVFEELTANAFRHGAGAVDVTIAATAAGWLLVVDDEAPDRPPAPAMGSDRTLGGMGLEMVAELSRDFGWQAGRGRKSVWAELPSHR